MSWCSDARSCHASVRVVDTAGPQKSVLCTTSGPGTVMCTELLTGNGRKRWEVQIDAVGSRLGVGVCSVDHPVDVDLGDTDFSWVYNNDGAVRSDGRRNNYADEFVDGDRIAIEVDTVVGSIRFFRNNKVQCTLTGQDLKDFTGPYRFGVTLWERSKASLVAVQDLVPGTTPAPAVVKTGTAASATEHTSPTGMNTLVVPMLMLLVALLAMLQYAGVIDLAPIARRYLKQ